ncbi:MAG: sigma-70 family RNA polymerase sigma factor [Pyrinomonadaceae bacterium]
MIDSPTAYDPSSEEQAAFVQLIGRARDGDARALDELMILSQGRVAATAWRMLGNEEDARDATQEVFLKAFKYLGSFKQERDFFAWLYGITVNVCRDLLRQRMRRADRFGPLEGDEGAGGLEAIAGPDDVEEAAIRAQERALVARALSRLTDRERAVIVLRDMEGLSAEEVSRITGSSAGTVRSQISSARAKIKTYCDRFVRQRRRG